MKWMIIILIMMSLIGSMMWVMPTQRQKYQAALRMKAKNLGYQVQLERVTAPRAKGEMEAEARNMTAYRLLRIGLSNAQKNSFAAWQIFRVESIADTGLPQGWSWSHGEKTLPPAQLDILRDVIAEMPAGVFSIESNPAYIGIHWDEEGGEEMLEKLKSILERFLEQAF